MTKDTYIKITDPFRKNPKKTKWIHNCNRIMTFIVFASYPLLLIGLFLEHNLILTRAIIVPLDSFIVLTALRYFINAPRPYEVFQMPPVIPKDTKGNSFPSRHVFSVFVIAMTFLATCSNPVVGICFLFIGVCMAVIRVLCGVHFPKDVVAGALFGILSGIAGFWIF